MAGCRTGMAVMSSVKGGLVIVFFRILDHGKPAFFPFVLPLEIFKVDGVDIKEMGPVPLK